MISRLRSTTNSPSHSRLLTANTCQRKYFYRYRLKLKELDDANLPYPLLGGSVGHRMLDEWHTTGSQESMQAQLASWPEERTGVDPWTPGLLSVVMTNYVLHYGEDDDFFQPIKVSPADLQNLEDARYELHADGSVKFNEATFLVRTPIGLMLIQPDMLYRTWSGELAVCDHKFTAGWLGGPVYGNAKYGYQLRQYCYALTYVLGEPVVEATLNGIHVGKAHLPTSKSKAKKFERYTFQYTPGDMKDFEQWFVQSREQIRDLEGKELDEQFWVKNAGSHCGKCEYEELCVMSPARRQKALKEYF